MILLGYDTSLSDLVRLFYLNAVLITVTLNVFPPFARHLYAYGKNSTKDNNDKDSKDNKVDAKDVKVKNAEDSTDLKHEKDAKSGEDGDGEGILDRALGLLSCLRVPHAWFTHFYALSLAVQLFWLLQILFHGRILQSLLSLFSSGVYNPPVSPRVVPPPPGEQSFETILLCILCMAMQSARRLHESLNIQTSSPSSKMGILIYIAGITHYTAMGLATFANGTATLHLNSNIPLAHPSDLLKPPRLNTLIALPLFFLASGLQHDAHVHLASLVKYSLPAHLLFEYTLSPHYLAECVIYGSLVILGAPRGEWFNTSLFYVWVFVCVNLTFGANITRTWYETKFGKESVKDKWRILPFIY
ncbi:hypothetical protein ABW20_dc0104313 [Dactylellina cionopaga]|nr:hypothetical protein ABW20_dc0104313 [Dactylellina cionopaga]